MTQHLSAPIRYFDQGILAFYRNEPDKWIVETDFFEGHLRVTDQYYEKTVKENGKNEEYVDIRFGYRALKNGDLAIAAWLPDLVEKSSGHLSRWRGFHLAHPEWAVEDSHGLGCGLAGILKGAGTWKTAPARN